MPLLHSALHPRSGTHQRGDQIHGLQGRPESLVEGHDLLLYFVVVVLLSQFVLKSMLPIGIDQQEFA